MVNTNTPKQQKDPVCGMTVDSKTSLRTVHNNKEYNFCCQECLNTFKKSPEKFSK